MEERSRSLSWMDERFSTSIYIQKKRKKETLLERKNNSIFRSKARKRKILMDDSVRIKTRVKRVSVERVSQTRIQLSIYESPLHVQSHGGS